MLSELAFPHIRCCLSAIPSDLMKSTAVDESLSSVNQQFCSRENQLLQRIQVGNGQFVSVLFIILVIIDIHGHRFKCHTLVSEIHENVDLVIGIRNIFELVGIINSQESCFSFLNRSIPFFPKEQIILK